jgi:hypothetical protein
MAKLAAGQKASQARRRAMLGSPPALTPSKSAPESLSTQRASIANMTKLSRTRAATPADVSDGYEVHSNIEESPASVQQLQEVTAPARTAIKPAVQFSKRKSPTPEDAVSEPESEASPAPPKKKRARRQNSATPPLPVNGPRKRNTTDKAEETQQHQAGQKKARKVTVAKKAKNTTKKGFKATAAAALDQMKADQEAALDDN